MKQVKNKLELKLVVLAAGITAAAVYIICVLAYLALPKPASDLLKQSHTRFPPSLCLGLFITTILLRGKHEEA